MPLVGEKCRKMSEFEHDGVEFIKRGANFEVFVEKLADGMRSCCVTSAGMQGMPMARRIISGCRRLTRAMGRADCAACTAIGRYPKSVQ